MNEDAASREPDPHELAIFIDEEGSYRILIPNAWEGKIPEFAYLAIAAVLRLAKKGEIEFGRGLARWAKESLDVDQRQYINKKDVRH